jgi:hypothetical protein
VDGGNGPAWSSDGSEIYFSQRDRTIVAAPFHANGAMPQPGKPEILFHFPRVMSSWSPSHKAGRFIGAVNSAPEEVTFANYMTGWTDKLEQ